MMSVEEELWPAAGRENKKRRCPNGTRKRVKMVNGHEVKECIDPCAKKSVAIKMNKLRKLLNTKDDVIQELKRRDHKYTAMKKTNKTLKKTNAELLTNSTRNRRESDKARGDLALNQREIEKTRRQFEHLEKDVALMKRDYHKQIVEEITKNGECMKDLDFSEKRFERIKGDLELFENIEKDLDKEYIKNETCNKAYNKVDKELTECKADLAKCKTARGIKRGNLVRQIYSKNKKHN